MRNRGAIPGHAKFMSIFDVVLIIILAIFIFQGFLYGLIGMFGSFAGFVLGVMFAGAFYETVSGWVDAFFFGYNNIGKFLVILFLFTLVYRLVSMVFSALDRAYDILSILPFLTSINKLGGAILGFLAGTLVLGLAIHFSSNFFPDWFGRISAGSQLKTYFSAGSEVILFFLPMVFGKVKDWAKSFVF